MKFYEMHYDDFEGNRLYSATWIWRQEYKVFVFFDFSLDDARYKARRFVGEGGTLTVEEIEFDSLRGIAVLMED
jgi:hypothetical protein